MKAAPQRLMLELTTSAAQVTLGGSLDAIGAQYWPHRLNANLMWLELRKDDVRKSCDYIQATSLRGR
jgi:hypothetical protein